MSDERESLKRTQELFQAALELDCEARKSFLADACGADVDLRSRLDKMLDAHEAEATFLDSNPINKVLEELPQVSTMSIELSLV